MKRPLCTIGFSALCVLAVVFAFEEPKLWLCVGAGGLLLWGGTRLLPKASPAVRLAILAASFACLYAFGRYMLFTAPLVQYCGEEVTLSGTVLESTEESGRTVYEVRLRSLAGRSAHGSRLRLYSYSYESLTPGSGFSAAVHLFPQSSDRLLRGRLTGETAPERDSLLAPLYRLRARLIRELRSLITDQRGDVAVGIFFGDTSGISEELLLVFRRSGLSHILAVSGTHLTLLLGMLSLPLRRLPEKLRNILMAGMVLLFMAFELFAVSVLRPGLMFLLTLAAEFGKRKPDTWNSLGGAVVLLLLLSPDSAADVGLQLSVSAVAGILLFRRPAARFLYSRTRGKINPKVATILAVSFGASLGVFPVSLLRFGRASVLGVFTAIPVAILTPVILVCSLAAPVFSLLSLPRLAGLFASWDALAVWMLCRVARMTAALPFGLVFRRDIPVLMGLLAVGIGFSLLRRRRRALSLSAGCLAVGVLLLFVEQALWGTPCLIFPDRESSYTAILRQRNETVVVLANCSDSTAGEILDALESGRSRYIDFLYLMGEEREDVETCRALLAEVPVGCLVLREENFADSECLLVELEGSRINTYEGCEIWEQSGNLILEMPDGQRVFFALEAGESAPQAEWIIADRVYWETLPQGTELFVTHVGKESPEQVRLREGDMTVYLKTREP